MDGPCGPNAISSAPIPSSFIVRPSRLESEQSCREPLLWHSLCRRPQSNPKAASLPKWLCILEQRFLTSLVAPLHYPTLFSVRSCSLGTPYTYYRGHYAMRTIDFA